MLRSPAPLTRLIFPADRRLAVVDRATGSEPITGGLRFRFPAEPGLAAIVADLAQAEQTCCAFLRFTVRGGAGAITLNILAPTGAEAILNALFQTVL